MRGDATWFEARDAARRAEALSVFGAIALAFSFACFGVIIARSAALPRAIGRPAVRVDLRLTPGRSIIAR